MQPWRKRHKVSFYSISEMLLMPGEGLASSPQRRIWRVKLCTACSASMVTPNCQALKKSCKFSGYDWQSQELYKKLRTPSPWPSPSGRRDRPGGVARPSQWTWQAMWQGALWCKGCEIDTVRLSIDNKLGHSQATGRGIQDAPAAMARGNVGSGDVGHLTQERQAILGHRAIARLHALGNQPGQGR